MTGNPNPRIPRPQFPAAPREAVGGAVGGAVGEAGLPGWRGIRAGRRLALPGGSNSWTRGIGGPGSGLREGRKYPPERIANRKQLRKKR